MKKIAVALILLTSCGLALAQTKPENQLTPGVRLYEPKNRDGAEDLARFVASVIPTVTIKWDPIPNALVIRATNTADLDSAEALLKRFDVARSARAMIAATVKPAGSAQIELTAYLVVAANGPVPTPTYPGAGAPPPPKAVPAELMSALDEMKHTFSYEHYTLADALIVQPSGPGEIQGEVAIGPYVPPGTVYSLEYKTTGFGESWTSNPADKDNLYLNGFQFTLKPPNAIERKIQTNVAMHLNQKFVLGKIRLDQSENSDLFVILTAKPRESSR